MSRARGITGVTSPILPSSVLDAALALFSVAWSSLAFVITEKGSPLGRRRSADWNARQFPATQRGLKKEELVQECLF